MANTMRWRYGDTNPVMLPTPSDLAIEVGDLVFLEGGVAKPASALEDQGSSTLNSQQFQDNFVGVAMQASPLGETTPIRIATSGVFEFDRDAATTELGAAFGVASNLAGTALLDQKVEPAATLAVAIGRCAKQVTVAAPRVLLDIVSSVMRGGPQARM